jgi:sugar phosphate isomerase/epimerase
LSADVPSTLRRVADAGYQTVELYDFVRDARVYADALPAAGLTAASAHNRLIGADLDAVVDAANLLAIPVVIDPSSNPAQWRTRNGIQSLAEQLNLAAAHFAGSRIAVGYHNHAFELENRFNGITGLEVFAAELDPAVVLEVDTYWVHVAGEDAPSLLARLGDRVQFLHIKDGPISHEDSDQVAVGAGVMPVREILAAAPEALPIVELDDFDGDVFDALRDSHTFLRALNGDSERPGA